MMSLEEGRWEGTWDRCLGGYMGRPMVKGYMELMMRHLRTQVGHGRSSVGGWSLEESVWRDGVGVAHWEGGQTERSSLQREV